MVKDSLFGTRYAWLSDLLKLLYFQAAEKKLIPELRSIQLVDITVDQSRVNDLFKLVLGG